MKFAGSELQPNRPEPIISELDVVPFNQRMDPHMAVEALLRGEYVLILDFYSSGLKLLSLLKAYVESKHRGLSFQGQRDFRSDFRELSNRILLQVSNHKLRVKKAPEIAWFALLYPELSDFLLPFPQIQGLNSAWQWYEKGIPIPGLDHKIHPFYGTYFPTRFEHLALFDQYLARYPGKKQSAIDVGIGCGVLSFIMLKHGFRKIYGTDINPNAIIGLTEYLEKGNGAGRIELRQGDLFAGVMGQLEIIVFNPPWLPAAHNVSGIDNAVYYDPDLFPRFFAAAEERLEKGGRLVLVFSNLAEITKTATIHPIRNELATGGRFVQDLFLQKAVGKASVKTKRDQHWRNTEKVELWVLKHK